MMSLEVVAQVRIRPHTEELDKALLLATGTTDCADMRAERQRKASYCVLTSCVVCACRSAATRDLARRRWE
jgi:hypothetical protein